MSDFPGQIISLASAIFQFHGTSLAVHRRLQELSRAFMSVSAAQVAQLGRGQAYGGFKLASNGLYAREAQLYNIRPTCVWAGGETLTVASR